MDENDDKTTQVIAVAQSPVIYADGIAYHVTGPGISKLHFYRNDALIEKYNEYVRTEVLQLIMPSAAFVDMVAFFERRLKVMLKNNDIPQTMIDEKREFYSKPLDEV